MATVDTIESSAPAHPSTRHHRCDEAFIELLEEDFGISQYSLRAAFFGVPPAPKKQAIELCEQAIRSAADPERAGDALRAWAKKHGRGAYTPHLIEAPPVTYETNDHLRSIGQL
jgi:hypothetical protein